MVYTGKRLVLFMTQAKSEAEIGITDGTTLQVYPTVTVLGNLRGTGSHSDNHLCACRGLGHAGL